MMDFSYLYFLMRIKYKGCEYYDDPVPPIVSNLLNLGLIQRVITRIQLTDKGIDAINRAIKAAGEA